LHQGNFHQNCCWFYCVPLKYSKSVLLIDDDPADRKLFARLLRRFGFDVIEAFSADAAMAVIVGGNIGCVVTDQVMPVSGPELARSVSGARADIGVIFISGGAPKPDLPSDATFISKEDREGLQRAVENCMGPWAT
jgi:CheY-like chemotaxis protein